ncbi:MAG: hypothetical protein JKY50_19110 [Oleispira sp.]|nr:hypothetical protein [Oleispira sp.]
MHRVLIPIDSQDPLSWSYAQAYAEKIIEAHRKQMNVVLLVHTKNQISSTSLSSHIGSSRAKVLSKGDPLVLPSGAQLQLMTLKTLGYSLRDTIIIAFYADEKMLQLVDDHKELAGVVVVPDQPGDANQWVARWGATIHGQAPKPANKLIADPIVENALLTITMLINLSTGLGNPRDKSSANEILRILKTKGHALSPEIVRSWAIQNGWRSDGADDLAKLARKIWALKNKPSLSKIYNWKERYASWAK